MATSGGLEEHISCSVCFEIYRKPHILRCLHTFCLPCIQQLQQKGRIQCPECREFTDTKGIKNDFKVQSLIDFHTKEANFQKDVTTGKVCEVCEEAEKRIAAQCLDCNQYICVDCEKVHRKLKATRGHKIKSIQGVLNEICDKLKKFKVVIEKQKNGVQDKVNEIDESVNNLLLQQDQQIREVTKVKDNIVKAIEAHHQEIVDTIKNTTQNVVESVRNKRHMLNLSLQQLQGKIDFLSGMLQSKDIGILQDTLNNLDRNIKENINQIKESIAGVQFMANTGTYVEKDEEFQPKRYINLRTENILPLLRSHDFLFTEMLKYSYRQEKYEDIASGFSTRPVRLYLIQDKLWCTKEQDGIFVFDKNCKLKRKIVLDKVALANGITETHNGDIVVAYYQNGGLHRLDASGTYIDQIAEGSYSDVCVYENKLFALEYKCLKIIKYKLSGWGNKWSQDCVISLNFSKGSEADRLAVGRMGIYVTSLRNQSMYIHNLDGSFVCKTGEGGANEAGKFDLLLLCNIDNAGNALVCDQGNKSLQVYDRERNTWSIMPKQERLMNIRDVVLSANGDTLWILAIESCKNII